jgi:ribosomal protein L37AE/L43A
MKEIIKCSKCGEPEPTVFLAWQRSWLCKDCNDVRVKLAYGPQ